VIHRFEQVQRFPRPLGEIFDFFTQVSNLESMTPPFLHFRNLTSNRVPLRPGAEIEHAMRLYGIPITWRTRIEHFAPDESFVDRQIRGPYKLWLHKHSFREIAGGTEMADQVDYELPLGLLGELGGGLLTRRLVSHIFAYRKAVLADRFGELRALASGG